MCGSEVTDLKTAEQELAQSTGPICSECFNRTSKFYNRLSVLRNGSSSQPKMMSPAIPWALCHLMNSQNSEYMTHTEDNHGFIWKIQKSPKNLSCHLQYNCYSIFAFRLNLLRVWDYSAFKTENTASKLYNRISCLIFLAWKPQAPFYNHQHTAVEIQRIFSPKRRCAPLCIPRILLTKVSATQEKFTHY